MFGGSSFGANTGTFGGGGFSSPSTSTSVFGQPQQQQTATSLFGGGGFGAQPKPAFGASTFGAAGAGSVFGGQNRLQTAGTGGLFGSQTATVSPFSSATTTQSPAGTSIPFTPINGTDSMMKNGQTQQISTRHQCITCMKEYENKSLEELRLEDYQLNRKGPQQTASLFGGGQPQQNTGGLFGGLGATSTASPFGGASTFGGASNTTAGAGGFFGSSFNQPKPGGFFSTPTTSSAFGAPSAFSFSNPNPTSQPTSVFGAANNNQPAAGGLGTTSAFSFGQPQQNQAGAGLFGQKPLTTSTAGTGFSFGGGSAFTNTSTANKPPTLGFSSGFGATSAAAPTFGATTTSGFGTGTSLFGTQNQQPQNKPFSFASPFSSQPQQTTQPAFGTAPATTGFSFGSNTSTPSLGFGTATSTFGAPGGTTSFGTPSFGTSQPSTGFGFGSNTSTFTGFPSFGNTTTSFAQPQAQQQLTAQTGPVVGFATTPYKDSPLFYNVIANRDLENMMKPTSLSAQRAIKEASRRRASTSLTITSTTPIQKNVTFPTSKTLNKSIFDGFEEEEDKNITLDILSPRSSVKKLSLKSFKNTSAPVSNRHSISFSFPTRANNTFSNGLNDSNGPSSFLTGQKLGSSNNSGSKGGGDNYTPLERNAHITINSGQNKRIGGDGDATAREHAGDDHGCRVKSTRAGYYIDPPVEVLDKMVDDKGDCLVSDLKIGRQNYGEIKFLGTVNVAGINMDEIVHFRHKEVVVYPDDTNKPPLGTGLNCPALVSLERVWPIDKATKDPIKQPTQLQIVGYENMLRKACQRLGAEFVSYDPNTGTWVFKVPHFSKYSCDVEESEVEGVPSTTGPPIKGLTGVVTTAPRPATQIQPPKTPRHSFPVSGEGVMRPAAPRKSWVQTPSPADDSMEMFRNRACLESTPLVPMEDFDFVLGDVEHNPLTPSESNETNSDYLASGGSQIESVLRDKSEKSAVRMMKSALLCSDIEEEMDEAEIQPPPKKSRAPPPSVRPKESGTLGNLELKVSTMNQRKSMTVMEIKRQKPTAAASRMSLRPVTEEKGRNDGFYPVKYTASVTRRETVPPAQIRDDLFTKLSLCSNNAIRYNAMPRVAFGPNGTIVIIHNKNGIGNPLVSIKRLDSYHNQSTNQVYMEVLQIQLKKQLRWDTTEVQDQIDVLWDLRVQHKANTQAIFVKDEIMIWELFQILWMDENVEDYFLEQRDLVARWFSKYSQDLFPSTLGKEPQKGVLGLLKMGRLQDAWKLAVKTRSPYLALLISQSPLKRASYATTQYQLELWAEEDAFGFIPTDVQQIYRLCSGIHLLDDVDVVNMTTSEWLQHFALHLWYACPPDVSLREAVQSFTQLVKDEVLARGKFPEDEIHQITFPSDCDSSLPNLCVQLLKLHSFEAYPLQNVINPNVYSTDSLDYKLAWFVMVYLRQTNIPVPKDFFSSIAKSFANQLEQIGLYTWGAFVMNKAVDRPSYCRSFLERNLGRWGSVENEKFLLENSLIDSYDVIYSGRAMRSILDKDRAWSGRVFYLTKAGQRQKAFEELLKAFTVDSVTDRRFIDRFVTLLKLMKPYSQHLRQWNRCGAFMNDTFQLLDAKAKAADAVAEGDEEDEHPEVAVAMESCLNNFLRSFIHFNPNNKNECAILIDLASLTQKIVAELISNGNDMVDQLGLTNIVALYDLQIPKDYKDELSYFVTSWLK